MEEKGTSRKEASKATRARNEKGRSEMKDDSREIRRRVATGKRKECEKN